MQADVPCLHGRVMQELGQGVDFEFWGPSGKIHILPLQNGAVCRDTEMSEARLVLSFPNASTACVASAVPGAQGSIPELVCCYSPLKHWKLLLCFLGWVLWGDIHILLWGGAFLGCFWGNEEESPEKFRMCCGVSPPCSQCGFLSWLTVHGY